MLLSDRTDALEAVTFHLYFCQGSDSSPDSVVVAFLRHAHNFILHLEGLVYLWAENISVAVSDGGDRTSYQYPPPAWVRSPPLQLQSVAPSTSHSSPPS